MCRVCIGTARRIGKVLRLCAPGQRETGVRPRITGIGADGCPKAVDGVFESEV